MHQLRTRMIMPSTHRMRCSRAPIKVSLARMTELLRATLTPARLDALPPALRARRELRALRQAIVRGPERGDYVQALAWNLPRMAKLDKLLAAADEEQLQLVPIK